MKAIKYIVISTGLVIAAACTHKFEEYNEDPNRLPIGSVAPSGLMEQTIYSGAHGYMTRFYDLTGELIQFSASGTGSTAVHRYALTGGAISSAWDHSARWAANADHIYKLAVEQSDANFQAIGLTLRALFMSNLTDIFGDIPFSEAFTIYDENAIIKMKFDSQKDVYERLLEDLENANTLYNVSNGLDKPEKDLLYGGDLAKWKKFTNSLRLRLLMRLSNRDAEMNVSAKIAEIFNNPSKFPVFAERADGAIVEFSGVTPFINTYGNSTDAGWNGRTASKWMISLLEDWGDPRINLYYSQRGQIWNGIESGMPAQDIESTNLSVYRRATLGQLKSPYALMRYEEVLFIKAEAAYHGWISGGNTLVDELYQEGISQSIRYWDWMAGNFFMQPELTISQYLTRVPYDETYETLMTQKFIALFWCGFEAWHEYRRTELPRLKIGTDTQNDGILPRRFEYPLETRETNRENYDVVIARYMSKYGSGDNMKTPVWWSLNAVENE